MNVANVAGNALGINPFGNGNGGLTGIINEFVNNVPKDSMKVNESNLNKLMQSDQNSVIKKILKSDYAQLLKTHN